MAMKEILQFNFIDVEVFHFDFFTVRFFKFSSSMIIQYRSFRQIKNIKLHIVIDIKVNFNSMLGFRISNLVGGKGSFTIQ